MPTGQHWLQFLLINLAFFIQIVLIFYLIRLVDIRKNWQKYRCNPMYMPLSKNIQEDFTYCVQTAQINLMGYILQPLTYLMSNMILVGNGLDTNNNQSRKMFDFLRTSIATIIKQMMKIFLNFSAETEQLTYRVNDTVSKVTGVASTLVDVIDGARRTSAAAGSSCFHPDTRIRLKNGTVYKMKNIPLGSILENGSRVMCVMKIERLEPLMIVPGGIDGKNIYVSGSHFIFDENSKTFLKVQESTNATKQSDVQSPWYSSLITSNGQIPIGNQLFWDWEDDILSNPKIIS